MSKKIIGIDIGGTTFSSSLFDEDLNIIIDESQTKQKSSEVDDVDFVIISILNKITANVSQIKLNLKENYFHDELRIYPIYCKISDPNERPEISVYLNIYDKKKLKKIGMNALLGVGMGSIRGSYLVTM